MWSPRKLFCACLLICCGGQHADAAPPPSYYVSFSLEVGWVRRDVFRGQPEQFEQDVAGLIRDELADNKYCRWWTFEKAIKDEEKYPQLRVTLYEDREEDENGEGVDNREDDDKAYDWVLRVQVFVAKDEEIPSYVFNVGEIAAPERTALGLADVVIEALEIETAGDPPVSALDQDVRRWFVDKFLGDVTRNGEEFAEKVCQHASAADFRLVKGAVQPHAVLLKDYHTFRNWSESRVWLFCDHIDPDTGQRIRGVKLTSVSRDECRVIEHDGATYEGIVVYHEKVDGEPIGAPLPALLDDLVPLQCIIARPFYMPLFGEGQCQE